MIDTLFLHIQIERVETPTDDVRYFVPKNELKVLYYIKVYGGYELISSEYSIEDFGYAYLHLLLFGNVRFLVYKYGIFRFSNSERIEHNLILQQLFLSNLQIPIFRLNWNSKESIMNSHSDMYHAIQTFVQSFPMFEDQKITPKFLSNGVLFAGVLTSVQNFQWGDQQIGCNFAEEKWTNRLYNLKIILERCEFYFEYFLQKGVKTRDIDLIKIAKDNDVQELTKLFQVIISVLMQAPNKSEYIEAIMTLDERSQGAFVEIIKNSMDKRVCKKDQMQQFKLQNVIKQLQSQNMNLQNDLQEVMEKNQSLEKQIKNYSNKVEVIETQLDKSRLNKDEASNEDYNNIMQKYQRLISNLKLKLINVARDHQAEIAAYREQIQKLQEKVIGVEQLEQMLEITRDRYQQAVSSLSKVSIWQKEKAKLHKIIQEKNINIEKLHQKIEDLTEKVVTLQQNDVYTKMELQRKDKKVKELERQFKNKLASCKNNSNSSLYLSQIQKQNISRLYGDEQQATQKEQEFNGVKIKLEMKIQELKRQNAKLGKRVQKNKLLQNQNKKLQSLVVQMNSQKNQEMQIIVAALYESHKQNSSLYKGFKLHE